MKAEIALRSLPGKRPENEDACFCQCRDGSLLAIVADGLGGHGNGAQASRLAVRTIAAFLEGQPFEEDVLLQSVIEAGNKIQSSPGGMSTAAVLWLKSGQALAAHIGDSRIYLFRDGIPVFQTADHSAAQLGVLAGRLSWEQLRNHPDRNRLFRVLGDPGEAPIPDFQELTVLPGDRFLLCTDGFWEPVTEAHMSGALSRSQTPEQWLDAMLVKLVQADLPEQDNATAIAVFL